MPLTLPEPVAAYLAADLARDPEMLARCFTEDARVHDEAQEYVGIAAIQAWNREAQAKYQYTAEPLEIVENGPSVLPHARLTGTFPGSPAVLAYTFTLVDGKIARLEIE